MKSPKVQTLKMVRRIRERHARALAGKSADEIIAFYRAAGAAATQGAAHSTRKRRTPANKALQPSSRAAGKAKPHGISRSPRR
jgi:ribosomal protein L12E/L44/L45/RPP1/RPP2